MSLRFWLAVAVLLACMGVAQVLSARQENQTWDEAFELGGGYYYLKTGVYRFNLEQPPVGKLISALPLLLLRPSIPPDETWKGKDGDDVAFGHAFLYENRVPADRLLFAGRLGTIGLTLLLGFILAIWTRRKFGAGPALFALALFAFDPNLLAHGRYTTTDLAAAAFIFFACAAWIDYLEAPGNTRLVWAGVALGLALAAKHTALILIPVFLCLHVIRRRQHIAGFLVLALVAYVTIALTFAPEANRFLPAATALGLTHPGVPLMQGFVNRTTPLGEALYWAVKWFRAAPNSYVVGLNTLAFHNTVGHESFLLGQFSKMGWWYYFPVVFLVKTPSAVLLALVLLLAVAVRRRALPDFRTVSILLPAIAIMAASMTSHINIGVRHILPIYPLLYVAIGAVWSRLITASWVRCAIAGLVMIESCAAFPNYLGFFNLLSGGPANGHKYLLESNLDWGQDLKKLRDVLQPFKGDNVCLEYFGKADYAYYGFAKYQIIPRTNNPGARARVDCLAAISANLLYGLYLGPDAFAWLRARQPIARAGGSILVYDLRKKSSPTPTARAE